MDDPLELREPRRPQTPGRAALTIALTSAILCAFVAARAPGPYGDLGGIHTDHLRHPYAAWVFLHRGVRLYTLPLGEAAAGVDYPHPMKAWTQVPYAYPPGAIALFVPLALIGRWVPMEHETFARACLAFTLLLAHLALFLVVRRLGHLSAATLLVGALCWLHLVRAGLQGFYDAAWIALGLAGLDALARSRPSRAIGWIALATTVHFRAIVLLPIGIAALVQAVRGRPWREWPWGSISFGVVLAALSGATFGLMVPGSAGFWEWPPLVASGDSTAIAAVVAASLATATAALRWSGWVVGATVLLTGGLALVDTRYWWHGSMLLIAPLAVGTFRSVRPNLMRALLVAWAVLLQKLSWGGLPNAVLREIARVLRT